jgi:hypothetical protein
MYIYEEAPKKKEMEKEIIESERKWEKMMEGRLDGRLQV